MIKFIQEYRFYISLCLFMGIPFYALDSSQKNPRDLTWFDKSVLFVMEPMYIAINWSVDQVVDGVQGYVYLTRVKRENGELIQENRTLLQQILALKEAESENIRLRQLLEFKEERQLKTITARIIARDVSIDYRSVRLNRGEAAGVKKGMAVITSEGIVGRVFRVTSSSADVVTLLDLNSAVDAVVERSRARGVVEGFTDETCQLKFVLRTDDIQVGDLLKTSGLGGIFPRGLPIGTVTKVARKPYGISQDVEVVPKVDFSKLEEVLVVVEDLAKVTSDEEATEKATEKTKTEKTSVEKPAAEKLQRGAR